MVSLWSISLFFVSFVKNLNAQIKCYTHFYHNIYDSAQKLYKSYIIWNIKIGFLNIFFPVRLFIDFLLCFNNCWPYFELGLMNWSSDASITHRGNNFMYIQDETNIYINAIKKDECDERWVFTKSRA